MVQYYNVGDNEKTNLSAYVGEINQFVMAYSDLLYRSRDYGTGVMVKQVEVYTLSLIEKFPGITVSELAHKQRRTKGTVSTNVSALEKGGYIYREKRADNAKVVHLYCTPAGEKLSTLYVAKTTLDIMKIQSELLKTNSQAELNAFCRVLHQYLRLISKEIDGE